MAQPTETRSSPKAVVVERSRVRGWEVAADGNGWLLSVHNTESEAVAAARRRVAAAGGGLVIHGRGASAPYREERVAGSER